MRLVLMADVHGNEQALLSAREALPEHDRVVVAGDLCHGGPRPAEIVDIIRELGWDAVGGNRDRDVLRPDRVMKPKKRAIAEWTREQLGQDRLAWLSRLPFSLTVESSSDNVLVVHANPLNVDEHLRPEMHEEDLDPYLNGVDASILAFGHLHIPYTRPVGGILLLDVGSIGHPKDRDLRAAFSIIEWADGGRSVSQVRVTYNVDRTVDDYRSSDMPYADEQIAALLEASY